MCIFHLVYSFVLWLLLLDATAWSSLHLVMVTLLLLLFRITWGYVLWDQIRRHAVVERVGVLGFGLLRHDRQQGRCFLLVHSIRLSDVASLLFNLLNLLQHHLCVHFLLFLNKLDLVIDRERWLMVMVVGNKTEAYLVVFFVFLDGEGWLLLRIVQILIRLKAPMLLKPIRITILLEYALIELNLISYVIPFNLNIFRL